MLMAPGGTRFVQSGLLGQPPNPVMEEIAEHVFSSTFASGPPGICRHTQNAGFVAYSKGASEGSYFVERSIVPARFKVFVLTAGNSLRRPSYGGTCARRRMDAGKSDAGCIVCPAMTFQCGFLYKRETAPEHRREPL